MSTVRIPTNFNIDLDFEIPEFYRRLCAWVLDMVILFFYLRIAGEIYTAILRSTSLNKDSWYDLSAWELLLLLPIMIYHPVCEITMNGQSLGKKILGLQVVNENGGRPSVSQFLIRWLIRTSDFMVVMIIMVNLFAFLDKNMFWALIGSIILLLTDIILVVTTQKSQRLGDILAKTIVIRNQTKGSIEDTVFIAVADTYVPSYPQIMHLSDRDINAIKSILESARKKADFAMADAAADKIKSHLNIDTKLSSFEFLEVLLKDYNFLSTK